MLRSIVGRLFGRLNPAAQPELSILKLEPLRSWSEQYPDVPKPDSSMSIQLIVARWACHDLYGEDMPRIATDLLEAGFDSPSLRRLAGETQARCSADVEPLIANIVRESGMPYPMPEAQVQLIFARQLAREVIAGQRSVWSAVCDLERSMWQRNPANEDLAVIIASNDDFEWDAQEQRFVPVTTSDLIERFAHLGSLSDIEIFSAS